MERPLVLAIVGTDHHPFDRLVGWLDAWATRTELDVRCFVQSGTSAAPRHIEWAATLPYDDLRAMIPQARVVISHGGPGTIMDVRQSGRMPIVVPRQHALGEHVDNHQVVFTERIASAGLIRLAHDEGTLVELVEGALTGALDLDVAATSPTSDATVESFGRQLSALYALRRTTQRTARRAQVHR